MDISVENEKGLKWHDIPDCDPRVVLVSNQCAGVCAIQSDAAPVFGECC